MFLNRPAPVTGLERVRGPRTVIVTGLARSGTSMIAQAVKAAGIFIGAGADDVVHEDVEIGAALERHDEPALEAIILARNISHQVWAFKRPDLQQYLAPAGLQKFRNPLLVVTFRDVAAMARRAMMSEQMAAWPMLEQAAAGQLALLKFLAAVTCPVMLVSYEKALAFPDHFVAALSGFVGGPETASGAGEMRDAVEPDRGAYIRAMRKSFEGVIDYVADGVMSGWAREVGSPAPVQLTLLLDDLAVANFTADQLRPDLAALGYGGGRHGFAVSVRPFLHRPHAIARVQVSGRTFELQKSGRPLAQLITR
jgi:hypothetical protein